MSPTKIVLEIVPTIGVMRKYSDKSAQLRVYGNEYAKGSTVIESTPIGSGKSLPKFRKHGADYAKRFSIPFEDRSL